MSSRLYEIDNISFGYPQNEREVLSGVSFSLEAGQVLSILGPNGAGKSTLLNCMAGLLTPHRGEIRLSGKPIGTMPRNELAQKVAYVQQIHVPAFSYDVFQFVMMGRAPHIPFLGRPKSEDEDIAWEALAQMGITHLADKPYTEISGGERQQAVIARALAQQPEAVLFDEPAAHLDFGNQIRILRLIRKMAGDGYAVAMTTHNPDHALLLEGTAAILDRNGRLRTGPAGELLTEEAMAALYGPSIRLAYIEEIGRRAALHGGIDEL